MNSNLWKEKSTGLGVGKPHVPCHHSMDWALRTWEDPSHCECDYFPRLLNEVLSTWANFYSFISSLFSPTPILPRTLNCALNIHNRKCTSGKQNFHLTAKWRGWQILSSKINSKIAQIDKKKKKTKTTISMPWKSSKSMQPSEKCLCLKTAELQVQRGAFWPRAALTPLSQLERLRDSARQGRSWGPAAARPQTKGNHTAWNSGWWPCQ